MIKYLGSKRRLISRIVAIVRATRPTGTVVDLFSGTSRVGHALKHAGYRVLANDYAAYAHALATCYVVADREDWAAPAEALLGELMQVPPESGYVTATFCRDARFFTPANGARIDAIRAEIEARGLPEPLRAIALVSLMEAADRVDSTTGVQMAYLKDWAPRASRSLELRLPRLLPRAPSGPGESHMMDAVEAARRLSGDIAYLDPPYNQHSYLGNYHIWETLIRWDSPEPYGVARKRKDTRTRRSDFNSKVRHRAAMSRVLSEIDAEVVIVSFNDEGFLTRDDLTGMLEERGAVRVLEYEQDRYVGARIGIFGPDGDRVGEPGRLRNREFMFIAGPETRVAGVEKRMERYMTTEAAG